MSTLSDKTRKTYLITGYIRKKLLKKTLKNSAYDYDSSISIILMTYIGSIFLKFDLCHDKYKEECIKAKGMKIKRESIKYLLSNEERQQMSARKNKGGKKIGVSSIQSAKIIFGSKCGLIGNEGVHKWKIRLLNGDKHVSDFIGITDNIDLCNNNKSVINITIDALSVCLSVRYTNYVPIINIRDLDGTCGTYFYVQIAFSYLDTCNK